MHPLAYCAVASCTDKDWEVFSVILAIIFAWCMLEVLSGSIKYFFNRQKGKES
jgi:hypothetical protein